MKPRRKTLAPVTLWSIGVACQVLLFSGCTVISYDRVFPKLTWAWTYQAKEQRRQNREREEGVRAYQDSLRTNHANLPISQP